MNCKTVDLAVVIADEPGCEDNIGRFVMVKAPARLKGSTEPWWVIVPADAQPWVCIEQNQDGHWERVLESKVRVFIEDRCLRPIRGPRQPSVEISNTPTRRNKAKDKAKDKEI